MTPLYSVLILVTFSVYMTALIATVRRATCMVRLVKA